MSMLSSHLRLPLEDLNHVVDLVGHRWNRLRDQRILLTGGTGFIGKWLLGSFIEANRRFDLNANLVLLSRKPRHFLTQFPELEGAREIVWLEGDVRELNPDSVGDCTFAIHAATDVAANSTPLEILDTCIEGTRRVLDVLASSGKASRLLILSSGAVYGPIPSKMSAVPETWIGAPNLVLASSAYGEGKRISELLATIYADTRPGMEVSIARCFAFVGPHLPLDRHFAIGNFIASAMRNQDILIRSDGTAIRSYLYSADLAYWLWVMLFDGPNLRAYNIGGAETLSIHDLAMRVNSLLSGRGQVRLEKSPASGKKTQIYVPSIERIRSELALKPHIDLDEAIRRTAQWASIQA